jgi:citrate lyase beta subunit
MQNAGGEYRRAWMRTTVVSGASLACGDAHGGGGGEGYGLRAIDGPYAATRTPPAWRRRAASPAPWVSRASSASTRRQIAVVNQAFTPSADEVARARAVVAAYGRGGAERAGGVGHDGKMIDFANIRMAGAC